MKEGGIGTAVVVVIVIVIAAVGAGGAYIVLSGGEEAGGDAGDGGGDNEVNGGGGNGGDGGAESGLLPHNPIYINGNSGFTAANGVVGGSGTESDPYIIENWDIDTSTAHGINIEYTTAHFIIRNCVARKRAIQDITYTGITLEHVANGRIENCISRNNVNGIWLEESSNNTLANNTYENNGHNGIILLQSSNNFLYHNICIGPSRGITGIRGIRLSSSNNNTLTNNTINNCYAAIEAYNSDNNRIYHNNLVNNAPAFATAQAHDTYGTNYWDDGYPSGGNYWSDYTGEDADGDGIGDTPYNVTGDNNQDRYPLMNPI